MNASKSGLKWPHEVLLRAERLNQTAIFTPLSVAFHISNDDLWHKLILWNSQTQRIVISDEVNRLRRSASWLVFMGLWQKKAIKIQMSDVYTWQMQL